MASAVRAIFAITFWSIVAVVAAAPTRAEDASTREQTILQREQRLRDQAKREAAEKESAAQRRRAADARVSADAQRREREQVTLEAVDVAARKLAAQLTSSAPFRIVANDGDDVTLAAGRDVGLAVGDAVDCVSRGAPIVVDGEQLGFIEKPLGAARVTLVQEKLATIRVVEPLRAPNVGDVCYRHSASQGKVALMPLLYSGRRTRLGESIQERLYAALSERGTRLVERQQMTRVIAEQKLGDSALVDAASAAHVGALVGADSVFMGSIDAAGRDVVLAARLVAARDGTIVAAQEVALPKNEVSLAMLRESVTTEDATLAKAGDASEAVTLDNPAEQARQTIAKADALLTAGDWPDASDAFRDAVALKPDLPEVHAFADRLAAIPANDARSALAKTEMLLDAGRPDEASLAFVAALALKPDLPEARHVAKRFQALSRDDARASLARADALITAGVIDEAGRQFAEALRLDPTLPDAQVVAQKLAAIPANDARSALAKTEMLLDAGRPDEASLAFVAALALKPDLPEARHVAKRFQALSRDDARASLARADALITAGVIDEAGRQFAEALRLDPTLPDAQVVAQKLAAIPANDARSALAKTEMLLDAGRPDEASLAFVAALALKPDLPEARHVAKRFQALSRDDARASLARADALITAGVIDEAGRQFAEALRLDPTLPDAQVVAQKLKEVHAADAPAALAKADALTSAGLVDEAAEAFVDALVRNPQLPETQDVAKRLRAATEQRDQKSIESMVQNRQTAARELLAAGNLQGADRMLAVALALAPHDRKNAALATDLKNMRAAENSTTAPAGVSLVVVHMLEQ